jgi:hypothetical protein
LVRSDQYSILKIAKLLVLFFLARDGQHTINPLQKWCSRIAHDCATSRNNWALEKMGSSSFARCCV